MNYKLLNSFIVHFFSVGQEYKSGATIFNLLKLYAYDMAQLLNTLNLTSVFEENLANFITSNLLSIGNSTINTDLVLPVYIAVNTPTRELSSDTAAITAMSVNFNSSQKMLSLS